MSDITTGIALGTLTAATLSVLGVEPQAVVGAAMGAGLGTTYAPEMKNWFQGTATFICVVGISAMAGTAAAIQWTSGEAIWRNLLAGLIALIFHPLTATIITKLPDLVDGLLRLVKLKQ